MLRYFGQLLERLFNIFLGENDYTFFGQLEDNSNVYFRIRYSY